MAVVIRSHPFTGGRRTGMGKKDYIQELLLKDIHNFRMESLCNFSINLFVYPASGSRAVYLNNTWIGFDAYMFDVFGEQPRLLRVRLCGKDASNFVEIRYQSVWCRVSSYLNHLSPPFDWNDAQDSLTYQAQRSRYDQQGRWWVENQKKFPIMDLPSEIREIIYSFAFGSQVEPYPTARARNLGQNTTAILRRKPNTSLLRLDKAVYEEASHVLFLHKPFYVEHMPVLEKLLSNKDQFSRIRQLELALTHSHFFRVFGLDSEDLVLEPNPTANVLKNMHLNRLEISFAAPSSKTTRTWLDDACQKIVVDWILEAAWPYIRKHPVTLAGYIKSSSRVRFDGWLSEEKSRIEMWQLQRLAVGLGKGDLDQYYADLDEDEGGVQLDVEQITEVTVEKMLPPLCFCKTQCTAEEWTDED